MNTNVPLPAANPETHTGRPKSRPAALAAAAIALVLPACALPRVNLSTPDPVKVDINVRLDVYQHVDERKAADAPKLEASAPAVENTGAIEQARRNRMGDVQMFKNSRIVGENHDGLLTLLNKPPGEYGDYVESTVAKENEDRTTLMTQKGKEGGLDLATLKADQAQLWRDRAFNGEWIEVPDGDGKFKWVQKGQE